jgi:hypothetical protein
MRNMLRELLDATHTLKFTSMELSEAELTRRLMLTGVSTHKKRRTDWI